MALLSQVAYPIIWWALLLLLDTINFRKWGSSLIQSNFKFFASIIIPFSAFYWLYFEFVNYVFPQWNYIGNISSVVFNTFFSFASFATVIPAIVELFWLFNGPEFKLGITKYKSAIFFLGLIFTILPFFSGNFWLNQTVWIAPFLLLAPFLDYEKWKPKTFWLIALVGLLSGIFWESLNFWVDGKWQYVILDSAPHLFEMPIYGYLGFIPFALSTLAAYLFAKFFFRPSLWLSGLLYVLALGASYLFALSL